MDRKNFIRLLGATAILPGINPVFSKSENQLIIKPGRLKRGDKVGVIAPGGYITSEELLETRENLLKLGFIPVPSEHILERFGYLAGTDKMRADDLNEMYARRDISGIFCARGGYGCARILPMLDYNTIKNNPKVIIGYSDVTALLYGIFVKTGLICFHGPVGISTFNQFSIEYLEDVLINGHDKMELINSKDGVSQLKTIKSGKGTGQLIGGNLSIIVSLIGTSYDIDSEGKLFFIEEVQEEPYRIDRMLTQMIQSGKFSKAAGIALGIFHRCEPKEKDPEFPKSFTLHEVFEDRLSALDIPVLYGLSFGHITDKFTIPFGLRAELNSSNQTLTLLEPAVL
jgi:muramoyltetrapeptide carboxypeptidase